MHDVHKSTKNRANQISQAGYNLMEIWECEWNNLKKQDACIQTYIKSLNLIDRLEPSHAFFGPLQTLYFDSNSLIYKQKGDGLKLQLGDFLREFTNELDNPNDHIIEFASAGPKNYGSRTKHGKICCNLSGFLLNT